MRTYQLMKDDRARVEKALAVNVSALIERWSTGQMLASVLSDAHNLREFSTIYCSQTGKPLGSRSALYLAEIQRVHGLEMARFVLQIEASKAQEHFTVYTVVGETLKKLMMEEPVTFFMLGLSSYLNWRPSLDEQLESVAERNWQLIQKKAVAYRNIHEGVKSGLLSMEELLTGCELVRRYLGIAGRHKQSGQLDQMLHWLLNGPVADEAFQQLNDSIRDTIRFLLLKVQAKRAEIKNKTNLIAEARTQFGGLGEWQALQKTDKHYSNNEATRLIIEVLGVDFPVPRNADERRDQRLRIQRRKERDKLIQDKLFDGKTHIAKQPLTIKFSKGD